MIGVTTNAGNIGYACRNPRQSRNKYKIKSSFPSITSFYVTLELVGYSVINPQPETCGTIILQGSKNIARQEEIC